MKRNLKMILAVVALGVSASAFAGNGLGPAGSVGSGTGPYSWRPDSLENDGHAHGPYSAWAQQREGYATTRANSSASVYSSASQNVSQ